LLMWWERRLSANHRFLISSLLFFSFASISVGFYFREHYFIMLLPAFALLTGVAASRGWHLLRHDQTIELFLAIAILGLFVIASFATVIGNGRIWFGMSPSQAVRDTYGTTLFSDAAQVGNYLKTHTPPEARIAVIGSEPEIYFHSRRRSATGYIYTYPLLEEQPYARKMQEEMIREIETARPEYLIFVNVKPSWAARPESEQNIITWYEHYSKANYDLVRIVKEPAEVAPPEDNSRATGRTSGLLLLFERKH